jgi:hypothetical protein
LVKRKRRFKAYEFLLLMVIGQMGMKHPSLAGMVAAIRADFSREALHKRFSPQAVAFMHMCLVFALKQKVKQVASLDAKALRPFARVMLIDSSAWNVHPSLEGVLPGTGGDGSGATCKLQAFYEYKKGELSFAETTTGLVPDSKYVDNLPETLEKGDLALFDLGYFKLKALNRIAQKKAFYLCRLLTRTNVYDPQTMDEIPLVKILSQVDGEAYEMNVVLGGPWGARVPCRLICLRVSDQLADKRRRDLKARTRRRRKGCTKRSLALCSWTLLITNSPRSRLSAKIALDLYMLRWQIELLFKQLKSILQIHCSNTGREARLRCELYGKLIGAILIHRIHAFLNPRMWNSTRKEVSMEKLYKRLQERAFNLLTLMLSSMTQAINYLGKELQHIARHCLKGTQLSRLTTLQLLDRAGHFDVEVLTIGVLS